MAELMEREAEMRPAEAPQVHVGGVEEIVADKGYHGGPVLHEMNSGSIIPIGWQRS